MANPFYQPGSARAAKVNDLFTAIARRYDFINDLQSFGLHRRWKRQLVRLADAQPGRRALDVCCGTGDITFRLAEAGASATGLDFNASMLAVADQRRKRAAARGRAVAEFVQGDALHLPFPDASFDIVTVAYGLRNLSDWRAGLAEMVRVARPGGRVLVLDFGKPDHPLLRGLFFGYLRLFVPLHGLLLCGNAAAYAYILESLKHYPAQHGVAAAMRDLGLTGVRIVNFSGGMMTINVGEKGLGTQS